MLNQTNNSNNLALPGHPYNARLQNGIVLNEERAIIINNGSEVASQSLSEPITAWKFWYSLYFIDLFPYVSHWWFYSGWTQRVRLRVTQQGGETATGLMQFVSEQSPSQLWFYDAGEVSAPYPTGETNPGNVPLRLVLSRLIYEAHRKRVAFDQWYAVTSLVEARQLPELVPTLWKEEWWPSGMRNKNDMRAFFCESLGLRMGQKM